MGIKLDAKTPVEIAVSIAG
ncbi:XdhC family protein [Terrisporobacter mayombei]|nr:XdhC family protein [Terrisporobacter mayombei]